MKLRAGTKVLATEDRRGRKFAHPEPAVIFRDFGLPYVDIRLENGQIHDVPRDSITILDER